MSTPTDNSKEMLIEAIKNLAEKAKELEAKFNEHPNLYKGILHGSFGFENKELELEEVASYLTTSSFYKAYKPQDIESHLTQASQLLDRCLKERTQWNTYAIENATLHLEVKKALKVINVILLKIEKGIFEQDIVKIEEQLKVVKKELNKSQLIKGGHSRYVTEVLIPNRDYDSDSGKDYKESYRYADKLKSNDAIKLSGILTNPVNTAETNIFGQKINKNEALRDIETENKEFKYLDSIIEIESLKDLIDEYLNGVLNYQRLMYPIIKRFKVDLSHAIYRISAAEKGLREIYGYSEEFNQLKDFIEKDNTKTNVLDYHVNWTRSAINWLVKFSRNSQTTPVSFNLYKLLSKPPKYIQLNEEYDFMISLEDLPENSKHVKIKGVSLFINEQEFENLQSPLVLKITPPSSGVYFHEEGGEGKLDQTSKPIFLNFISKSSFDYIYGQNLINNFSPIEEEGLGKWKLQIINFGTSGKSKKGIQFSEIYLNLHIQYS